MITNVPPPAVTSLLGALDAKKAWDTLFRKSFLNREVHMIYKMKWARECSTLALALPELKEQLDLFETRFMKDTVVAHESESSARSIELRRCAILSEKSDHAAAEFPAWVKLLGRRNPENWEPKRLARIKKKISRSNRHSDRKLDEILLVELIGKSFGRNGDLMELVSSAAYCYTSPWAWKGTDGSCEYYSKAICNVICRMHLAAFPIGALAWSHQRVWRNLPSADEAATSAIEAVMAGTETILLLGRKEVIVETDNQTFLAMEGAAKRLEEISARLVEQAKGYSPTVGSLKERWNYDLTGVTMCLRYGGVYIDKKVGTFGYIAADIRGIFKWLIGYRRPHRFCWVNYLPRPGT